MSFKTEKKFPADFMECMDGDAHVLRTDIALFLKYKADVSGATTRYYGFALPGTGISASAWMIRKETLDANGNTTAIDFARNATEPNRSFVGVWDNRASESYA